MPAVHSPEPVILIRDWPEPSAMDGAALPEDMGAMRAP